MSDTIEGAVLFNGNHSYPKYPTGLYKGEMTLSENGIVFRPNDTQLDTIPIHLDNIISTYATCQSFKDVAGRDWFRGFVPVLQLMLVGEWRRNYGYVSIKFKEAEFDKLCVISIGSMFVWQNEGQRWAESLDAWIWDCKRAERQDRIS